MQHTDTQTSILDKRTAESYKTGLEEENKNLQNGIRQKTKKYI